VPPEWRLLGDVLLNIGHEPLGGIIFMKGDYPWDRDSSCIVLHVPDEEYLPGGGTEFTKSNSLKRTLGVADVEDIVHYARSQEPNVTLNQLVDSFNYYYKYDGPLDFDEVEDDE
jgi:hypothetical protein